MDQQTADSEEFEKKRFRSPPYPAISLEKALERSMQLYESANQHSVPSSVLASAWGYAAKSSSVTTLAAALKHFGLIDYDGSGKKRRFRLADNAVRIIKDPIQSSEKRVIAVKEAALKPKIHTELWDQFGAAGLKESMEGALKGYLTLDRKDAGEAPYSDEAADEVIDVFKESLVFAKLGQSDIIPEAEVQDSVKEKQIEANNNRHTSFGGASLGDLIQWESGGTLNFETPKRVRAIQTHQGVEWVFVDGSETGIPMNEVIVEEKSTQESGSVPEPPLLALQSETSPQNAWKEVTRLTEGEVVLALPGTLSVESYEDLKTWMDFILSKARRRAGAKN